MHMGAGEGVLGCWVPLLRAGSGTCERGDRLLSAEGRFEAGAQVVVVPQQWWGLVIEWAAGVGGRGGGERAASLIASVKHFGGR